MDADTGSTTAIVSRASTNINRAHRKNAYKLRAISSEKVRPHMRLSSSPDITTNNL